MSAFLREIMDVAKAIVTVSIVAGFVSYVVTAAACIAINAWRGK